MSQYLTVLDLSPLDYILKRDGFVIFICGGKEKGKTDFSLSIAEYCYLKGFRKKIATNIRTESYIIEKQITNFPDLEDWLKEGKRKLYNLDEAGKHLRKMRFMSQKNIRIMDIIQLIRHYDAGFIGIAPSESFIDSNFLNTDILDLKIKKVSKQVAIVRDYLEKESFFLYEIPPTTIKFDSKDIANFDMERKIPISKLRKCCQVAEVYRRTKTFHATGKELNIHREQIKRLMMEHLEHTSKTSLVTTNKEE